MHALVHVNGRFSSIQPVDKWGIYREFLKIVVDALVPTPYTALRLDTPQSLEEESMAAAKKAKKAPAKKKVAKKAAPKKAAKKVAKKAAPKKAAKKPAKKKAAAKKKKAAPAPEAAPAEAPAGA